MNTINIAIVTDDRAYGQALARGLRYRAKKCMVNIYSCGGFTEEWKKGGLAYRRNFDVVLWDGPDGKRIKGENIAWVTDGIAAASGSSAGPVIYRYDTVSDIYGRVMDILGACEKSMEPDRRGDETRVMFFGSWQGDAGCSHICREVAEELVRFFGKRVMWLSLDGIEPGSLDGVSQNVDYYLYSVLGSDPEDRRADSSSENRGVDLDRYLVRDGYGVESLAPSLGRNPLPLLKNSDATHFLSSILCRGSFDAVMIDGGDCCSESAAIMLGSADRICLVKKGEDGEKRNRYMNWLTNVLDEDVKEKMTVVADEDRLTGNNIHALTEALWYNEIDH